jgi:type II secretory pathway component PulF
VQPQSVAPLAPPPTERRSAIMTDVVGPLLYKVPLDQLLFFFRQLGTMLNAGVPIVSSLDTLARQSRDPRIHGVIHELQGHVQAGRELSVGMQRYPEIFSPLMLSLIRAGEQGGMLDASLTQMADYIEREIALRNLIRKATLYPKIVIFCSIFIILGANYIIHSVFNKPGGIATPLTEPATWVVLTPLIVFLFLFFRVGVNNPRMRHSYDHVLLKIPGIGSTVHQMAMAKFSRAFAALYKGGVPMPKAVLLSADACGSDYLRSKIYPAGAALEEGMGITEALGRTGAFSGQVIDMTQTGETTGRLDEMLEKVADYYEDDSTVKANQLAIILGVVCFLAVAAYVAYIVINFYSGQMSTLTQQQG